MGLVTKDNTFTAGASIIASEHNDNFDTIYNEFNGNIENANIKSSAAIADTKLAQITTSNKVSITAHTTHGARAYNDANISHATSGTAQALTFNQERYDDDSIHSTSSNTGRLTATTAGHYIITGHVEFAANATGQRTAFIRLNGSTNIGQVTHDAAASGVTDLTITTIYELAATDYVELVVNQDSGGALNVLATANRSPEFAMQIVSP